MITNLDYTAYGYGSTTDGGVHDIWGNLTPIGTASTRGSPQTELTKKMKFRHIGHLETG